MTLSRLDMEAKPPGKTILVLPSREIIAKSFSYDPAAGRLVWNARTPDDYVGSASNRKRRCDRWNKGHAGKFADSNTNNGGYRRVYISAQIYAAHRVIYKLVTGVEPEEIDHINGDRKDNRIENLRSVSARENAANRKLPSTNKTGVPGVFQDKRTARWGVRVGYKGGRLFFGYHKTFDEAVAVRARVMSALGYHENHGRPHYACA